VSLPRSRCYLARFIGNTEGETKAIEGHRHPQRINDSSSNINVWPSSSISRKAIAESARVRSGILRPRAPRLALVFAACLPEGALN